jgi:EcsC protein family
LKTEHDSTCENGYGDETGKALRLVNWITDHAINGFGALCSAAELADQYRNNPKYRSDIERIDALIKWETSKNFTSGFVTGFGGIAVMPVTIPAAFGASWVIQARMAAAIASLSGHDITCDQVRTFVIISLAGDAAKDAVKAAGIAVGQGFTKAAIGKISGRTLIEINKKVGFRLITKAGERGVVNLGKAIPVVGGFVGGTFDSVSCLIVGKQAKRLFLIE